MSELPFPDLPPDQIWVNSWLADSHPSVVWQSNGQWGTLTLTQARNRAKTIFQAIGYAEAEGAIVRGLVEVAIKATQEEGRGFGITGIVAQKKAKMEAMTVAAQVREMIRQTREPLPQGIEAIYGLKKEKPLVNVSWYGEPIQWEPVQAQQHAIQLLESAEAAESDGFFLHFLEQEIGVSKEECHPMIQAFQTYRHRQQLEETFNADS